MLSDESSSDSETGRFKGRTKTQDDSSKNRKEDFRSSIRNRPSERSANDKYHRDIESSRSERDRFDRYPRDRDRNRFRSSPVRRRPSRERSPARKSPERHRHDSRGIKPSSGGDSRDRSKHSRFQRSPERKRDLKEEIRRNIALREKSPEKSVQKPKNPESLSPNKIHKRDKISTVPEKSQKKDRVSISPERSHRRERQAVSPRMSWRKDRVSVSPEKFQRKDRVATSPEISRRRDRVSISPEQVHRRNRIVLSPEKSNRRERIVISPERACRRSRDRVSVSPDHRSKRSEIYKPQPSESRKRKSESPIIIEEHNDPLDEIQPGSYYSMIPAVVKEKSEESSEIDSSDDEKLRAKLLNLEKELHKTKKKKHKKKHRKKHSRSDKESDQDTTAVEVSSTTDIPDVKTEEKNNQTEPVEVSSTQKSSQKESGEEGEIISDDDSQNQFEIDPSDLRHKLKRSIIKADDKKDVCGPALPPHLSQMRGSGSPSIEGPALPPHLKGKSRNIGPSIPDDMRKILSEKEQAYESSDEDVGIGPLPSGSENKWSEAHQRLEERALDMKLRKLDGHTLQKSNAKSREEWMLELPEGKAKYLGLEARSFRAKEGPDMTDRSSWTDTPEEKARKAAGIVKEEDADVALQREARARQISNRDDEQESAIKKHKKKHRREESLLEMHQKKLKKKKKKEEKEEGDKQERRPFSRDVDLQVNRFDEAQKRSIIKKAQALDTRFSRGEAKYL